MGCSQASVNFNWCLGLFISFKTHSWCKVEVQVKPRQRYSHRKLKSYQVIIFFAKDQFLVCWFSQLSAFWLSYNYSLQWSQATAMPLTTENIFLHLLKACFSRKEPGNTPTSWQRAQWWGASQLQSKLRPHNQWAHPHRHASAGKLWPGPFRATHFQFTFKSKAGFRWFDVGDFRQSKWWENSEYKSKM